jgi:hypothetical protein
MSRDPVVGAHPVREKILQRRRNVYRAQGALLQNFGV